MHSSYIENVRRFTKKDAVIALLLYAALIFLYAVAGLVKMRILGIPLILFVNIIFPLLCILIVQLRKQGLASLGIHKKGALQSMLAGTACGLLFIVAVAVIPAIGLGWKLAPLLPIVFTFLYQLFIIALCEEVMFRGYLQTRLYGLTRNDVIGVLLGALCFSLMHAPYQLASGNRSAADPSFYLWLLSTFMYHILFNTVFRKYNSIYGVVIMHALFNTAGSIFDTGGNVPDWYNIYTFSLPFVLVFVLGGVTILKRTRALSGQTP